MMLRPDVVAENQTEKCWSRIHMATDCLLQYTMHTHENTFTSYRKHLLHQFTEIKHTNQENHQH